MIRAIFRYDMSTKNYLSDREFKIVKGRQLAGLYEYYHQKTETIENNQKEMVEIKTEWQKFIILSTSSCRGLMQ